MNQPTPMRFKADLQSFQVLDTQTGAIHQSTGRFETANLRSRLEVAHRPAATAGMKEQKRRERREAGQ